LTPLCFRTRRDGATKDRHPRRVLWVRDRAIDTCPTGYPFRANDERWERLTEKQGIAYAKTVAEAMNLKLDADNPADREKLRRAVLNLVAGRKIPKQKDASFSR
jgi:hypothetical protein